MDKRLYNRVMSGQETVSTAGETVRVEDTGRTIGKIYGYMGIGLAVTAIVAFLISFALAMVLGPVVVGEGATDAQIAAAGKALNIYFVILGVSGVALFIDTIAMSFMSRNVFLGRSKTNLMIPYMIYAVLMGVFMSTLVVAGIDFWTMAEAFGITALVFGVMFVLGYYVKVNWNAVSMSIFGFVFALVLASLVFFIVGLVTGNGFLYYIVDFLVSIFMMLFVLVVVATDAHDIKRFIEAGRMTTGLMVYFAFDMYLDFIYIFIRVLSALVQFKDRD